MKILNHTSNLAVALGFCGLMMVTDASAATITKAPTPDNPFSLSLTDIEVPPSLILSFDKFDTALGTLTGVVYRLESSIDAAIDVLAVGASGVGVEALVAATFGVTGPGISASEGLFPSASCIVGSDDCASTGGESSFFTGDDLDPRFVVAAADLAAYQGSGSVDATLTIEASIIDIACSGPLEICTIENVLANWGGSLVIDYIFTPGTETPVPVPATLVLFGAGLLALSGLTALRRA